MRTTNIALTLILALSLTACHKKPKPALDGVPEPDPLPMAMKPGAPAMRTPPSTPSRRVTPAHPTSPRPGQCASGLLAPELKCSATAQAATCRLTDPCMGRLKLSKADDARLSTPHGKPLGELRLTADGRGLTIAHRRKPGAALQVHLSFGIRNTATKSPYRSGRMSRKLAGVKNARKAPSSYQVSLIVPGAKRTGPVKLVLRKSIGPVKLGMTRADLGRLGLTVRLHPSGHMGNNVLLVGPYYVVLDKQQRVRTIEWNLSESAAGLKLSKRVFGPKTTPAAMARAMPGCGKLDLRKGGSLYTCDDGHLLIKMGGPILPPLVAVQIFDRPVP